MQDKESAILVEIIARAICFEQKINPDRIYKGKSNTVLYRGEAQAALIAIKEAGYAIVRADQLWLLCQSDGGCDAVVCVDENGANCQCRLAYRAMITAGEE